MKKNKTTKTTGQIIFTNVCTLFNLINIVLGILVLAVGSPKNALFLLVAILSGVLTVVGGLMALVLRFAGPLLLIWLLYTLIRGMRR